MSTEVYAPLFRCKQAERLAMRDLYPDDADRILPIVEVVPFAVQNDKLSKLPRQFQDAWAGRRMIVDGSPPELRNTNQARDVYSTLAQQASNISVGLIPVVQPNDMKSTIVCATELAKKSGGGMALRVPSQALGTAPKLLRILNRHAKATHLIVDFGIVNHADDRYLSVANALPLADDWETVIFLGGAFPKDLTGLEVGQHLLPRYDWISFLEVASSSRERRPLYGDYTIQHAVYSEPPTFPNFSASIRYTAPDSWVVMRGEGVRNRGGAGYAQWPANAQLLCERNEFCGGAFSAGDTYIEKMGTAPTSNGNAGSWLRAGINHHISMASRQVASLSCAALH